MYVNHIYNVFNLCAGQSFPSLSELLTTKGFPVPPSPQSNSSIPTSNIPVFQWVFPSLNFEAGVNITGWLFQAESFLDQEELILGMDGFTLWDRCDDTQSLDTEVLSTFTQHELNSARASYKLQGSSHHCIITS